MLAPDISTADLVAHLDRLHDLVQTYSPAGPPPGMRAVPEATVLALHDACDPKHYTPPQTRAALEAAGLDAIYAVIVLEYGLHCRALQERGVDTFVHVARLRLWLDAARHPSTERAAAPTPPAIDAPQQQRLL